MLNGQGPVPEAVGTPLPTPTPDDLPGHFPELAKVPARTVRLALEFERTLRRLGVVPGMTLLLAVSGGADSMALAALTGLVRRRLDIVPHLVACDHGLRAESAAEVRFVQAFAGLAGLDVTALRLGLDPTAPGLEERARTARYRAIERVRRQTKASFVLLGHHAGDVREDILLRLLRGTGWPGLGGMQEADEERHLLRPLLEVEPETLRLVLDDLHLPHCEDASNLDTRLARNRLRLDILPALRAMAPGLDRSLTDLARLARVDRAWFAERLDAILDTCPITAGRERADDTTADTRMPGDGTTLRLFLPAEELQALPCALRLRLYLAGLRRLVRAGVSGQARLRTLMALDRAWREKKWPRLFELPGGLTMHLQRQGILLEGRLPQGAEEQDESNGRETA